MRVKFLEDVRDSIKEDPKPAKVPTIIEISELSMFDDDLNIRFYDLNDDKYVSTLKVDSEYERGNILSQLLERGYTDLTKYGAFIYNDGEGLEGYTED